MLDSSNDLGAHLFKTWTEQQRCEEIEKLVQGYRNGVPLGILCKMAETIAGSRKTAKKYLKKYMTESERTAALGSATGGMIPLFKSLLK